MQALNADSPAELAEVIEHAEAEAERLLTTSTSAPLDVVVWLSAHLAALERSVYPVVKKRFPDGSAVVAQHREIAARLSRTLRVIERRHSGDVLASGLNPDRLLANLRSLVEEHHIAQTLLVERLVNALSQADRNALRDAYESALEHAPTRPHPHLARSGMMFRIDALRDKILDTMDGRHVPVPRLPRHHLTPGRWGAYLLGQQHDGHHDDA